MWNTYSDLARDPKTMNENLPWFCKTIFLCLGPKSSPKCKCWVHCINSKLAHVVHTYLNCKKMLAQLVKQNRLGRLIREKGYVVFTNLHIVPILYLC